MILTHLVLFGFIPGAGGTETTVGRVPRGRGRRVLVTVKGRRFQVPEEDLELWLAKQEEELVEKVEKRVRGAPRIRKPPKAPQIVAKNDDGFVRAAIEQANLRVRERIEQFMLERAAYRAALQEEEEVIFLFSQI